MEKTQLRSLLEQVVGGNLSIDDATEQLSTATETLEFATLDHGRADRCGMAEVVFGAGKTPQQIVAICRSLIDRCGYALVTRAREEHVQAVREAFDKVEVGGRHQAMLIGDPPPLRGGTIPIVTAGTSDEPIAEEAVLTCRALGQPCVRINDIGVAGLHRLINRLDELQQASVIICIAGMEGALPSVIGGLVSCPVIAVPTSVGYGAALQGVAALLGMLTSCASGVSVVNIDNGFGAAYSATLIQRLADAPPRTPQT